MTKLVIAIFLIVSTIAGCDSNPTPHPARYGSDATDGPNGEGGAAVGGDVLGTELGMNPEPGDQDPNECPCANPGRDDGYGEDDGTGRDDDNTTDDCDDDNVTPTVPESDSEAPAPTVRKSLPD